MQLRDVKSAVSPYNNNTTVIVMRCGAATGFRPGDTITLIGGTLDGIYPSMRYGKASDARARAHAQTSN